MKDEKDRRGIAVLKGMFVSYFLLLVGILSCMLFSDCQPDRKWVSALARHMPWKDNFVALNGAAYRLGGRRLCNKVLRDSQGMLKRAQGDAPVADSARKVVAFREYLRKKGVKYVFVLMPWKSALDGDEELPPSLRDNSNGMADAFMGELARVGFPRLDFRKRIAADRALLKQYFYRTDHHWNYDGAFTAFSDMARYVCEWFKVDDRVAAKVRSMSVLSGWHRIVFPDSFLGSYGKRTGRYFGGRDDLVVYLPKFKTHISMEIPSCGVQAEGSFRSAVMRRFDEVQRSRKDDVLDQNSLCYIGGTYPLARLGNPESPLPLRVFMIGDSFCRPIAAFFSTIVSQIEFVDPRRLDDGLTVVEHIEKFKPDLVLQVQCPPSMLVDRLDGPPVHKRVMFEYGITHR